MGIKLIGIGKSNFPKFSVLIKKNLELVFLIYTTLTVIILVQIFNYTKDQKKNHFFSRIHVEDIAEILFISLKKFNSGEIFNISDDYPSSNVDLIKYAASLINVNLPKSISVDQIENEMLKDFYRDSKKVKNQKMKNFFGHNLKYPTFKEGLKFIKNHTI